MPLAIAPLGLRRARVYCRFRFLSTLFGRRVERKLDGGGGVTVRVTSPTQGFDGNSWGPREKWLCVLGGGDGTAWKKVSSRWGWLISPRTSDGYVGHVRAAISIIEDCEAKGVEPYTDKQVQGETDQREGKMDRGFLQGEIDRTQETAGHLESEVAQRCCTSTITSTSRRGVEGAWGGSGTWGVGIPIWGRRGQKLRDVKVKSEDEVWGCVVRMLA